MLVKSAQSEVAGAHDAMQKRSWSTVTEAKAQQEPQLPWFGGSERQPCHLSRASNVLGITLGGTLVFKSFGTNVLYWR